MGSELATEQRQQVRREHYQRIGLNLKRSTRNAVRGVAVAANAMILVPYALFVLNAAFNVDRDAWPLSGLGALY